MDPSHQHYPASTSSDETEDDAHLYDHLTSTAAASTSRKRSFDTLERDLSPELNGLSIKGNGQHLQQLGGGGGRARGRDGSTGENTGTMSTTERQQRQQLPQQLPQQQQQPHQPKFSGPSPSLRKEQNRAAQRAFRDRKERYVHQLEGIIKEQKEQHIQATSRFQTEVVLLRERNTVLQSENHYLREVIFAFEAALSKGAALGTYAGMAGFHRAMLQSIKEELFTRHHAKKAELAAAEAAKKTAPTSMPALKSDHETALNVSSVPPSVTVTASDKTGNPIVIDVGVGGGEDGRRESQCISSQRSTIDELQGPSSTTSDKARRSNSTNNSSSTGHSVNGTPQQEQEKGSSQAPLLSKEHPAEDVITGPTSEVLFKAPPLFIGPGVDHGLAMLVSSPFESITVPNLLAPKSSCPDVRYPNYPTVFDELQSSLFPPGTLRSLVHKNMATPREVVEDNSLFDRQPASFVKRQPKVPQHPPIRPAVDPKRFPDPHLRLLGECTRLQKECEVLMAAPPATDPKIDSKIFDIPHDSWIDLIPCAPMKAQLILHQDKYNSSELWSILLNGAICHGDPLDVHAWELPDIVFTKYAFLWGQSAERHRRKVWPRRFAPPT